MADEFRLLESFGAVGDGAAGDQLAIKNALIWSAGNDLPVYGFHDYRLGAPLQIPANATLIATPTARFIRGFGDDEDHGGDGGSPLVTTDGDQPDIRIEGGLCNGVPGTGPAFVMGTVVFGSNTISFPGAAARYFTGTTPRTDVLQQVWVYKRNADGDYDPAVINNNTIFTVSGVAPPNANTIYVDQTPVTGSVAGNRWREVARTA